MSGVVIKDIIAEIHVPAENPMNFFIIALAEIFNTFSHPIFK